MTHSVYIVHWKIRMHLQRDFRKLGKLNLHDVYFGVR